MTYLAAFIGVAFSIVIWAVAKARHERRKTFIKQERLSSAFDRSHAVRLHGDGAQGISQNILIAALAASATKSRR